MGRGSPGRKAERIPIAVTVLVDVAAVEAVQATRDGHNPRTTPARVVTGLIRTTGLATGPGPMAMRTGTVKSGRVKASGPSAP